MGNWRRVQIIGTCATADVPKLREALEYDDDLNGFHCLCCGGMFGLPNWAAEEINIIGNLAERGYGPQDVADQLLKLLAVAPSLDVKVHCGDDYEEPKCIKTVAARSAPVAMVLDPEVSMIPEIPLVQANANMLRQLTRR